MSHEVHTTCQMLDIWKLALKVIMLLLEPEGNLLPCRVRAVKTIKALPDTCSHYLRPLLKNVNLNDSRSTGGKQCLSAVIFSHIAGLCVCYGRVAVDFGGSHVQAHTSTCASAHTVLLQKPGLQGVIFNLSLGEFLCTWTYIPHASPTRSITACSYMEPLGEKETGVSSPIHCFSYC